MKKTGSIQDEYGDFSAASPGVEFQSDEVPENLRHLIPYANFWGITDDWTREDLVKAAPEHLKVSLQKLIADNDDALDAWLAGKEASNPIPSKAYLAFSAMRMAVDCM